MKSCIRTVVLALLASVCGSCQEAELAGIRLTIGMPQQKALDMIAQKSIPTVPPLPLPKDWPSEAGVDLFDAAGDNCGSVSFTDGKLSFVSKRLVAVDQTDETSSLFQVLYSVFNKLQGERILVVTDTRRTSYFTIEEIRISAAPARYAIQRHTGYGPFKPLGHRIVLEEWFGR